ncbi:major facilitator superfamily transporter, partial [Aphelenchoides avenae]
MVAENIKLEKRHEADEAAKLVEHDDAKVTLDASEAQKALEEVKETVPAQPRAIALKVIPRRWTVLFVMSLLSNTNTMTWISLAPVANHVDAFYAFENATSWFSMIYMMCIIPVGFFAMWAVRTLGLRWAILFAACANAFGGLIRVF